MTNQYHQPTMTVAQLIEALGHFDPALPVYTEGCDCIGKAAQLVPDRDDASGGPAVLISRWLDGDKRWRV